MLHITKYMHVIQGIKSLGKQRRTILLDVVQHHIHFSLLLRQWYLNTIPYRKLLLLYLCLLFLLKSICIPYSPCSQALLKLVLLDNWSPLLLAHLILHLLFCSLFKSCFWWDIEQLSCFIKWTDYTPSFVFFGICNCRYAVFSTCLVSMMFLLWPNPFYWTLTC